MDNLSFEKFQKENGYGSAEKYRKNKDNTYNQKNIKSKVFTLSDWQQKSELYIMSHVYDIGKGEFIINGILESQLNISLGY